MDSESLQEELQTQDHSESSLKAAFRRRLIATRMFCMRVISLLSETLERRRQAAYTGTPADDTVLTTGREFDLMTFSDENFSISAGESAVTCYDEIAREATAAAQEAISARTAADVPEPLKSSVVHHHQIDEGKRLFCSHCTSNTDESVRLQRGCYCNI